MSVGAEAIDRPLARRLLFAALHLAHYRSYRDRHSADRLRASGFRAGSDPIYPDLAFSLALPAQAGALAARPRPFAVAVGIFNYRGRGADGGVAAVEYREYLSRIASLILWLVDRGHAVRLIIGDLAYDEGVRADLRGVLASRGFDLAGSRFIDEPAGSFEALLEQLAAIDLVVATRFHNVLLALLLGKPVLSMSYEGKNEALMREMGMAGYCQSLDGLDIGRLLEQFQDLERRAEALRGVIAERAAANRARLDEQYDHIVGIVRGAAAA